MCGIFGLISKKGNLSSYLKSSIIKELYKLSETRGKEASGFSAALNNRLNVFKTPFPPSELIKKNEFITVIDEASKLESFMFFGHSRLVTNGSEEYVENNQPVIKSEVVGVHNGIVVNTDLLWKENPDILRESELDSELLFSLLRKNLQQAGSVIGTTNMTYKKIYGMSSIAYVLNEYDNLFLATNNGSLYYVKSKNEDAFIFASEYHILKILIKNLKLYYIFNTENITKIHPGESCSINLVNLESELKDFNTLDGNDFKNLLLKEKKFSHLLLNKKAESPIQSQIKTDAVPIELIDAVEKSIIKIDNLKRCSNCLLPETFPFIKFDSNGKCNVCSSYKKIHTKGISELEKIAENTKKHNKNKPDVLIPLSGGRDSCYVLHYVKKELKLNPIAFSFDWGMLTDLSRRNQARLCGKLGVEHILISADIRKKRDNIKKNISAWLGRPSMGTIPLFMAGDKQYFYHANKLKKNYNLNLIVMGENPFEKTLFKTGFTGAKQNNEGSMAYNIGKMNKILLTSYYLKQFIKNPAYINASLIDTMGAYLSYYFIPHDYLNFFDYFYWDEKEIEKVLFNEYDWETSPDSTSTWRIGDGTAAFYNYIYYIVAGFTENDTFRSNQIREGIMSREYGMNLIKKENTIRWDSIHWYCDTIGLDFSETIKTINKIQKLY